MKYYTYIYLDPRKSGDYNYDEYYFDHEPLYVGKGKGKQIDRHISEAKRNKNIHNTHKSGKIRHILSEGLEPIRFKIKENLSEQEAFDLEMELIKLIGRVDLGTGPLTNLTDGGEGTSGNTSYKNNPDLLIERSRAAKEQWKNPIIRQKRCENIKGKTKGRKHTIEVKNILSDIGKKRCEDPNELLRMGEMSRNAWKNPEYKNKMIKKYIEVQNRPEIKKILAEKRKGKTPYVKYWFLISPDGKEYYIKNLVQFCKDMGLNANSMCKAYSRGNNSKCNGWLCQQISNEDILLKNIDKKTSLS